MKQLPRGRLNPNGPVGARASVVEPNFNVSPTFKPWKWLTTYFTYNCSQAYAAGNGGRFPAGDGNGNATIPVTKELHTHSDLYEAGAKASIIGDTLFINAAIFQQHRINPGIAATYSRDTARGFEIEADYQPSRNFYLSAGYSYLNSFIHGSPAFVAQVFPIDSVHQLGPGGTVISDNSATLPRGVYREPGVPAHAVDHLEAKIALLNLTNQKLWGPPDPVYGYDSVVAEWPFHVEGTITIKF